MTAGGESWLDWLFKVINFAVLVAVLVKYAGKPLKNYLVNRHNAIKEKLEEAERKASEAEALRAKYEERLAGLEKELEAFKKDVLEETEKERKKILADAEAFAARIKQQAAITYEQEVREITGRIKEEIARLTVEKAESLIREKVGKKDHDQMVEDFIEKLRSLN